MKRISVLLIAAGIAIAQPPPAQQERERKQAPEQQPPAGTAPAGTLQRQAGEGPRSEPLVNESFVFMEKAAGEHTREIRAAQLAVKQASRQDVKDLAQKLIADHTKALEDLKALARQKGMAWPAETKLTEYAPDDDPKSKANWDKMAQAQGPEFDRMWLKEQIEYHKKDIKKNERISRNHSDSDIRAFATKLLPALQGHLEQAKTLSKNRSAKDSTSG